MDITWKYSGLMETKSAVREVPGVSGGLPSMPKPIFTWPSVMGLGRTMAEFCRPGWAWRFVSRVAEKAAHCFGVAYWLMGRSMLAWSVCSVSKPGFTEISFEKLRRNRPAATNKTIANAISAAAR